MKHTIKFLALIFVLILISFKNLNQTDFNLTSCNEIFYINGLSLDLCNNSGAFLMEEQISNGLGSSFVKTFQRIDETSFEDTGGKSYYYEYSEIENTDKTVFISVFVYPNNNYFYDFNIDSSDISFRYNSGTDIKIGDSLDKVSSEFQSKDFEYDEEKKTATINIIDEAYLTFYFDDNSQLKSISFDYHLI